MAKKSNNLFDTSVFNEVRPTYVGPPVEEVSSAREYLTATGRENQQAKILMEGAYADTMNSLSEDPDGVAMVKQHASNFLSATNEMVSSGDFAYMGPAIRNMAAKFAGDNKIKNRQTRLAEFQGKRQATQDNDNVDEDDKQVFAKQQYQFNGNDELGTSSPSKYFSPFERVDVNKQLLDVVKNMVPNLSPVTGIRYYNATGEISGIQGATKAVAITTNGEHEIQDINELKMAFTGAINNNPAMRNYLFQKMATSTHYNDTEGAIATLEDAVQHPDKYSGVIGNAVNDLADALAYDRKSTRVSLQNINLEPNSSGGRSGTSNPNKLYGAGINQPTKGVTSDEVKTTINTIDNQLDEFFNDPGVAMDDKQTKNFHKAILTNDGNAIRQAAKDNKWSPNTMMDYVTSSQKLQFDKAISQAKLDNASDEAMYTDKVIGTDDNGSPKYESKYKTLEGASTDPLVNSLATMGFNVSDEVGGHDIDKVMTMANDITKEHTELRMRINQAANSPGSITNEDFERLGELSNANAIANDIKKKYKKEYAKYKNTYDEILSSKNVAHDEILTDEVMGYSLSSRPNDYKQLAKIFESKESLKGFKLHNRNNDPMSPVYLNSISDIKVDNIYASPTKAGDSGSASWVVPYTATDNSTEKPISGTFRIPMEADKGGVEQDIFSNLVKNSPYYKASRLVDDVIMNNVHGRMEVPGYEGFAVNKDTRSGKTTYSTPKFKKAKRDEFTQSLSTAMGDKDISFLVGDAAPAIQEILGGMSLQDYSDPDMVASAQSSIYDAIDASSYDLSEATDDEIGILISHILSISINAKR